MSKKLRRTVGAVLIAFHLAGDIIWPQALRTETDWLTAIGMGFSMAQVSLIAAWAALAPSRLMVRLPWALFMGVMMWYALVLAQSRPTVMMGQAISATGAVVQGRNEVLGICREDAFVLGLSILFGILVIQVPLWVADGRFGWRLVVGEDVRSRLDERQFRLSHLLAGMFLLSVALGLGRVVLPAGDVRRLPFDRELWILLPVVVISNLLVTLPCIWGAFASWKLMPWLAGSWVLYAGLVSVFEMGVLIAFFGPPSGSVPIAICLLNLSQCVTVLGTMLLLRAAGFRLLRIGGGDKPATDALR